MKWGDVSANAGIRPFAAEISRWFIGTEAQGSIIIWWPALASSLGWLPVSSRKANIATSGSCSSVESRSDLNSLSPFRYLGTDDGLETNRFYRNVQDFGNKITNWSNHTKTTFFRSQTVAEHKGQQWRERCMRLLITVFLGWIPWSYQIVLA